LHFLLMLIIGFTPAEIFWAYKTGQVLGDEQSMFISNTSCLMSS
jgi:hypothetical protein